MANPDKSRHLTIEQDNAIDLLVTGLSDREVGQRVGVSRQTVTDWRNHHPQFIASLNLRRREVWGNHVDRLRQLIGLSLDVLEDDLKTAPTRQLRQAAAVQILKAAGAYDVDVRETGPVDPEEVQAEVKQREKGVQLCRLLAGT